MLAATPVIFVAFDLLACGAGARDAASRCCATPLRERRERLEGLGLARAAAASACRTW